MCISFVQIRGRIPILYFVLIISHFALLGLALIDARGVAHAVKRNGLAPNVALRCRVQFIAISVRIRD